MKKQLPTPRPRTIGRLLSYVKPYMFWLVLALFFALLQIAATLFAPIVIGNAIDYIIGKNNVDFDAVFKRLFILGGLIAAASLFQWLVSLCTNKVAYRTIRDIRRDAFDKLNRVPLKVIDGSSRGDLMTRVGADTEQISDGLIQGFTQLFTGVVTVVGTLCFMLGVNPWVTLVVVVVTPLSIIVAYFIAKGCHDKFAAQSDMRGKLGGLTEEMLSDIKTVKAFSYEQTAEKRFDIINCELKKVGIKAMFYSAMVNPCTRFVNGIVYAAVAIMGAFLAIKGDMSVGDLSCFLTYANQYTKPFNEITGVITELQTATAAAARVFKLLDEKEEADDSSGTDFTAKGNVSIRHAEFSYSKERPLITDFNLEVKSGQRVAIVGPTGCGKTTLINLLMRFYDVNGGEILIDGVPIKDMTRKALRRNFGMVLQDSWLFRGTIRENIAYGKDDATQEEIEEAAKKARIHNFIMRLKDGYDTVISDNGDGISQGQRQLLCIARVMLMDPPMLILDEATSNIDTRTEIKIQKAFALMMQGRTSFIVAHRLSTIKEADIILVMKDGNVIEKGNHASLMQQGGFYKTLFEAGYGDD
ncbi:MAG: ABC transporter ATP-binding protein [Clostridia bacterium]|nr:ABC transporter ATP-binding protein [Clostridia bacterium]